MAVVIVTTPSASNANSYASVAEADAYVNTYVLKESNRDAWLDLDTDDKARLLIQATRQIDWYFNWQGCRSVYEQPLEWPRRSVWKDHHYIIDWAIIPTEVIHATVEMALWLRLQQDDVPKGDNAQFDSLKVGSLEIDFNENAGVPSKQYMPDKVVSMLEVYGYAHTPDVPTQNQVKVARLIRT